MGRRINETLQEAVWDVIPVGIQKESYDILKKVDNIYEITLPPVSFTDFMVGRKQEILDIKERLRANKILVVINGIGGIGKTTVCKYLFRHSQDILNQQYRHIAWVNYDKNLADSFIKTFRNLDIPFEASDDSEDKFEKIIFELNKLGDKLLIFIDNVDKVHRQDKGIAKLLQSRNHVILTSRVKVFDEEFLYPLGFLDDEKCQELFLEYYSYSYPEKGRETSLFLHQILALCGNHSLTVELLAKTANEENYTLKTVLSLLKKEKFGLYGFGKKVTTDWDNRQYEKDIDEHIEKVFSITRLTQAQKENLIKIAMLAPVEIEIAMVRELLKIDNKQLDFLIKRGWVISDGKMLKMHRVVKHAIRKQRTTHLLNYNYIPDNFTKTLIWEENHKELDLLMPHAEEIFREFYKSNTKSLCDLSERISEYYKYQGDMRHSIQYMKKRVTLLKRGGHAINDIAACKKNMAAIYMEIGKPEKALEVLSDVLHMRKGFYKPDSLEMAECYAHIGFAYQEVGDYKKMLTNYKKALNIRIKADGKEGIVTAQSLNNLALAHALLYDFTNSLQLIDGAISIRVKRAKEADKRKDLAELDVAQSVNIKGFILSGMGRYEEALPLLEESMKTREKYLGRDNVITATAYQRFALALCMNGCMKDAYDYINKAVDIYRKESGNNTTDMAITYGAYAILERRNNNIKNAEKLHKKGIDIITKLYNPHHPRLLQFYEELADTYLYFAEAKNALVYYKKAMEVGREFLNIENCKLHDLEKRICEASSLSF